MLARFVLLLLLTLQLTHLSGAISAPPLGEIVSNTNHNSGGNNTQPFLSDWVGALLPIIGNQTVLDLALPGTHDTMTWDLSTTVADNANSIPDWLAWLMHEFKPLIPGDWIRNQSRTQILNITQQLDSGIRFLDFRVMYTAGPNDSSSGEYDWYNLHFVESRTKAIDHLQQVHDWLMLHTNELVVLWLSRHGNPCQQDYPDVSHSVMFSFFQQVQQVFGSLLFDSQYGLLNETTINQMMSRGQRVVLYMSDYANFTQNSTQALDACTIDNDLSSADVSHLNSTGLAPTYHIFNNAATRRAADKRANNFYLVSMAGGAPKSQLLDSFFLTFLDFDSSYLEQSCAADFHVPGMTSWCPMHLQTIAQLQNYYNQLVLEAAFQKGLDFPNAIYIDAVDCHGTIRTGTNMVNPLCSPDNSTARGDGDHEEVGYAYADTVILHNVKKFCATFASPPDECTTLPILLQAKRDAYPLQLWDDPSYGRLSNWPTD